MPCQSFFTRRLFLASAASVPIAGQEVRRSDSAKLLANFDELRSRATEAVPITAAERFARIERARELMREEKLNAILLAGGSSLQYFTGVQWGSSERLLMLVLPAKGEPFFICPAFEEGRLREQLQSGLGARQQVFSWQEDESPYALTASSLKERGLLTARLGVEETVKFVFSEGVSKAAATSTLTSATPVTAGCRSVKSASELALMRLANQVTLQAYEAAWKRVQPGMTNGEFRALIAAAHAKLGFAGSAMVLVDDSAALPQRHCLMARPGRSGFGKVALCCSTVAVAWMGTKAISAARLSSAKLRRR